MSAWTARKFWTQSSAIRQDAGWAIALDDRLLKTPAKATLTLPTQGLALAIAAEWDSQSEKINPDTMPLTRFANVAQDKMVSAHAAVVEMLAAYGDADLLCYRAASPVELVALQSAQWDPVLDWAGSEFGARLAARTGVMHVQQDPENLARLQAAVAALDCYELAGFHDLVTLSGSLVLGLAALRNWADIQTIWDLSRLDENWQIAQWGADEEATEMAEIKRQSFFVAREFVRLAQSKDS